MSKEQHSAPLPPTLPPILPSPTSVLSTQQLLSGAVTQCPHLYPGYCK